MISAIGFQDKYYYEIGRPYLKPPHQTLCVLQKFKKLKDIGDNIPEPHVDLLWTVIQPISG